jgi:hypothetical protein
VDIDNPRVPNSELVFAACKALPLWSSGQEFLATDPEARVRFPALPENKK